MPKYDPNNITVTDLIEGRDWYENHQKELEDQRDELLAYRTQFKNDYWIKNKLTVMLYNTQNEIEQAEYAIQRLNQFIVEDLKT